MLADTKPGERVPPHFLDKLVGIGIEDVAPENLVYHKALKRNVGATVEV
jgi:ornithine cyclodeaminase/alanine dehydrogenase-like protein (mu-crystallin family)